MTKLIASLTGIDVGELSDVVASLESSGVDGFHVDLSDGHFVPGLLFPPSMVASVVARTALPVEAHLMTYAPENYLRALVDSGASRIYFHWEAVQYPMRLLSLPEAQGCEFGVALNPHTAIPELDYVLDRVTAVSLLSTEPDHQGQRFLPGVRERIARLSTIVSGRAELQIDGGVDAALARQLVDSGATELVVGRAVTASTCPERVIAGLRSALS